MKYVERDTTNLFNADDIRQEAAYLTIVKGREVSLREARISLKQTFRASRGLKYVANDVVYDAEPLDLPSTLTDRQATLCRLLADGYTQAECGSILGVSDRMVRKEIEKLGPVFG